MDLKINERLIKMKKKMINGVVIITLAFLLFGLYCFSGRLVLLSCKEESQYAEICLSESMEPVILTNSIVIIDKTVPFEEIKVNDIIQFDAENEFKIDHSVSHKVSEIDVDESGEIFFHTVGINNDRNGDEVPEEDLFHVTRERYGGKITTIFNFFALPNTLLYGRIPQHADGIDAFESNLLIKITAFATIYIIALSAYLLNIWVVNKKQNSK